VTLIGALVLLGWIPAAAFLYFHGRTRWYDRPAGQAVFVMAVVVFIVMTLALITRTLGIDLPDWIRVLAYGLILVALWWKLVTILRYEYGNPKRATSTLNPGTRLLDPEETR
jgi:hypothetical protein